MDEISADELYEGLLAYGLFSEKLPPVFSAGTFYDYCSTIDKPFEGGWSEYISFRTMRNINLPRVMAIPNPFKYQRMCAELRDDWSEIQKHFHSQTDGQKYRVSRLHIRKKFRSKCLFEMNYKNWRVDGNPESDMLIHDKGISHFLVKADIATCFPSIYTHAIPWAAVGKEKAKNSIRTDTWYNRIDERCREMCNGETHGLLIGPHTSNLIAEIVLTVVDKKLYDSGYRYTRNIDDFDCYVDSNEKAQLFLRDLEDALREFDLPLNHKKTKIIELPIAIEENWINQLSELPKFGKSGKVEYPQVNTFIDTVLNLATQAGDFAVIKYAIKKLKGNELSVSAKKLAAKRFMHMAALYPYFLRLMEEYVFEPYGVNKDEIKALSDSIYQNAVKIHDYESIYYVIYFAIKYEFPLDAFEPNYESAQAFAEKSKDCLLLVMVWLYYMAKNHGNRGATQVKPLNKIALDLAKTEMDRYWLFCYEALTSGNLSGDWKSMKEAEVSFIRPEILEIMKHT